jgi:hypothetical protein
LSLLARGLELETGDIRDTRYENLFPLGSRTTTILALDFLPNDLGDVIKNAFMLSVLTLQFSQACGVTINNVMERMMGRYRCF